MDELEGRWVAIFLSGVGSVGRAGGVRGHGKQKIVEMCCWYCNIIVLCVGIVV